MVEKINLLNLENTITNEEMFKENSSECNDKEKENNEKLLKEMIRINDHM